MNFLDFIFDNLFIVAIVVIGLFNLLSGMGKKNAKEEQKQVEQKPVNQPSKPLGRMERSPQGLGERIESVGRKAENKLEEYAKRLDVDTSSKRKTFEEQRQEQYDRLKSTIQSGQDSAKRSQRSERPYKADVEHVTSMEGMPVIKHHKPTEVGGLKLEDKLTARGLIDSVIMAEVLGPPRAQNPYQNIAAKRKRR